MRSLALAVSLAIVLAGCADDNVRSFSCPEEFGPQFQADYNRAWNEANETVREAMVDTDGDCMADRLEKGIGTNPDNGTDYPSLEQMQTYLNSTAAPGYDVASVDGAITAGAGQPDVASYRLGTVDGTVKVKSGTTLIYAEIQWDGPMDIDLAMQTPDSAGSLLWEHQARGGAPGAPDSPHSLTITAPVAGDWGVTAFPNGPTAMVEYAIKVTTFYGATSVPDGYTAF